MDLQQSTLAPAPPTEEQLALEREQLAILLEKGATFRTRKRSLLRFFGSPQRTWRLQQPYLGTLDYLASEMTYLDFTEEALKNDWLPEARRLTRVNARRCARIIAIAVLNNRLGIQLLTDLLSRYFLWRLNPSELLGLVTMINDQSNLSTFILSIRLMSLTPRSSKPARIETKAGGEAPV